MPDEGRRSLSLSLVNIAETLRICVPTVFEAATGHVDRHDCDDRLSRWCWRVLEHADIRLTVRGREHVDTGATYVVMSNHQSLYDVPVIFCVLGGRMRMVAKEELFRVPIFGAAMREAGFIFIDRSNRNRAIRSLGVAKSELEKGTCVWIAPEGTRSRDGALGPFKKGGFHLALETRTPVLPITVKGTRNVLRAKGVRSLRGVAVEVVLHEPVAPDAYLAMGRGGRDAMMAEVRRRIESAL